VLTSIISLLVILGVSLLRLLFTAAGESGHAALWPAFLIASLAIIPSTYGLWVLVIRSEQRQGTIVTNDRAVLLGIVPAAVAALLAAAL
jgi:hypothetical protein